MPEVRRTATSLFRQAERYYCSIWGVKAQSGFRVKFKCYQRSLESLEPTLLRALTLLRNSRRR